MKYHTSPLDFLGKSIYHYAGIGNFAILMDISKRASRNQSVERKEIMHDQRVNFNIMTDVQEIRIDIKPERLEEMTPHEVAYLLDNISIGVMISNPENCTLSR
jgi:hypothetical protein